MSPTAEPLDCQRCGACCCNPAENRAEGFTDYVEIEPREKLFKKKQHLARYGVANGAGLVHLKLVGTEERCAALHGSLGKRVSCAIYQLRPRGCRLVEAGSKRCLQARADLGL